MKSKTLFFAALAFIFLISQLFSQIKAGQSIIIRIMGVPEEEKAKVDDTYAVSKNGKVNLPFIGEIQAAGLDSDQLEESIKKAYRDAEIYTDAAIQVFPNPLVGDDFGPKKVHIGGQVRKPGPIAFAENLTVDQAVQAAGGATEIGAINRVILWRDGKQQIINLRTTEGKEVTVNLYDTIEVPQKNSSGMYILYIAAAIIVAAFWKLAKILRNHRLVNRVGFLQTVSRGFHL